MTNRDHDEHSHVQKPKPRLEHAAAHACDEQAHEFRAEIDRRFASLDCGEGIDGDAVFARIREKSARRLRK